MSDWFSQAIADVGNAIDDAVDAVVDVVDDVVDAVVDVVDTVVDVVEDVVDVVVSVVDAAGDVVGAVVSGEDVGGAFEDAAAQVGDTIVDSANEIAGDVADVAGDVADFTLSALDTFVFDPVDFVTGGAIDVDYADGQLTADLDFGIASVGVSVGDQGFSAEAGFDIGIASGEISYDAADGFAASGSIGIDWGPLPYAEGHMNVSPDGEISIGGHLQGTIPFPGGSIGGEIDGGLYRNADGSWGATTSLDVNIDGPMGTGANFSTDTSVGVDADGNFEFDTGVDVSVSGPGGTGASLSTDTSLGIGDDGIDFDTGLDVAARGPGGTGASFSTDTSLGIGDDGIAFDTGADVLVTGPGGTHAGIGTNAGFSAGLDADGNLTSTADAGVDVDVNGRELHASGGVSQTGLDLPVLTDLDVSVSVPNAGDAMAVDPTASAMSALAGSGDLGDVLGGADDAASALFGGTPLDASQAIDAANAMVDSGVFDDFTSDVVSAEIVEAEADQVWDDVGP